MDALHQPQPQPSSSTAPAALSLPSILPFAAPVLPPTHLTGAHDLVTELGLRGAYDSFVRPYFRNPKPLIVPLDAPGEDVKGKGRAAEPDGGGAGVAAAGAAASTVAGTAAGPAAAKKGAAQPGGHPGQSKKKEVDPSVMELKRFKDLDELVPECLVLPGNHPAIKTAPISLLQLVMDSTDDAGNALPSEPVRRRTALELQGKGWRLAPGELAEAKDPALFVRQPKPEKKKKKRKQPPPPDQSIGTAPTNLNPLLTTLEIHKRHKASTPGATPRTPGLTPGGFGSSGPAGSARTPVDGLHAGKMPQGGSGKTPGV